MTPDTPEFIQLGGAEEIGANSTYINLGGNGIIIDAGLHPRRRDAKALPDYEPTRHKAADYFILTHAHSDHVGGLPYLMKFHPGMRFLTHRATRDVSEIMLRDSAKLLRSGIRSEFPEGALSLYNAEILQQIGMIFEGLRFEEPLVLRSDRAHADVKMTLFPAGHILGAAGILLECEGFSVFHTGDVSFDDQSLIPKASFPRHHVDVLITECTNGADESEHNRTDEIAKFASFINQVSNEGGSVLVPVFSLGKTQEVLKILYDLMRKGSIPTLPMYTGGMSKKISTIYDRYCYSVPRVTPGFELTDIPQVSLDYGDLHSQPYLTEPSIVVASSGMMNRGTASYKLAWEWHRKANFGIAFVGYQDPDSPGYALLHSEPDEPFHFVYKNMKRRCKIGKFRFTAHASRTSIVDHILDVRPKKVFLIHGENEALDSIGLTIKEHLPGTKVCVPRQGISYDAT